ncbi:hypothetical protein ACWD01_36980 [Streptomyces sp. NPDC002835]
MISGVGSGSNVAGAVNSRSSTMTSPSTRVMPDSRRKGRSPEETGPSAYCVL